MANDAFDDDPICEATYAMLLVSGDHIALDEFTRLFGVKPTEAGVAGDCSCWKLSSEGRVPLLNSEAHIQWILDRIEGKQELVHDLKGERNCQVDIGVAYKFRANQNDGGPLLSPDILRRISDFGMNLILYVQR